MSTILHEAAAASRLSRARRLVQRARVRGLRRVLRAATQAYVYAHRSWYILYRPIPERAPAPACDFELRQATLADLDALAAFEPNRTRREFRDWLEGGAQLFLAFDAGRPVAFQCFSDAVPVGPPLSSLRLAPGQMWTVDVQTLPAYRRHHVAQWLREYRDRVLFERGAREYVSSVQSDNLPALRYAYGDRRRLVTRVQLLSYRCVLGVRHVHVERDALSRLERLLGEAGLLPEPADERSGVGAAYEPSKLTAGDSVGSTSRR